MQHSRAKTGLIHPSLTKFLFVLFALLINIVGCHHHQTPPDYPAFENLPNANASQDISLEDELSSIELEDEDIEELPLTTSTTKEEVPLKPIKVVEGQRTPLEGKKPSIKISGKANLKKLRIKIRNWKLGAHPGNHVHLIIDNHPYFAIRDVSKPLDVLAMLKEANIELQGGLHLVRAFPSRHNHESVKAGKPITMKYARVGKVTKKQKEPMKLNAPMLTYSRPKGCYPASEPVLLDFYLSGLSLSAEGYKVKYSIDDKVAGLIANWSPHWIQNLPIGDHTITLTLIDQQGLPVEGFTNQISRTISIQDSCQ